jgi:hypothetical protein
LYKELYERNFIKERDMNMRILTINGIYKHFKGNYYVVIDTARSSETNEKFVIYKKIKGDGSLWIRPVDEFLSEVDHEKYPDVKQKYRFELQEIDDIASFFEI